MSRLRPVPAPEEIKTEALRCAQLSRQLLSVVTAAANTASTISVTSAVDAEQLEMLQALLETAERLAKEQRLLAELVSDDVEARAHAVLEAEAAARRSA